MSDNDKIIAKIKKCLALSASASEHEASTALRQAQKLMEAHDITDADVLAANVNESVVNASTTNRPSQWEGALASIVARSFGCTLLFGQRFSFEKLKVVGQWVFVGAGQTHEVARYCFEVLHRQVKRARTGYVKECLCHHKKAEKTRLADLFCKGWVRSVEQAIVVFAGQPGAQEAVNAYMQKYQEIGVVRGRDRNVGREVTHADHVAYRAGKESSKDVQLHRGVGGVEARGALPPGGAE